MKIYVLLEAYYEGSKTICVSEDIHKIRTSICENFNANGERPELEIWENGECIYNSNGNDVFKKIAGEINTQ